MAEILYVEGDDLLRRLYAERLRQAGFGVREARFAAEGLDAVRRAPPDLVLLDVAMPRGEMSGTELLARLREEDAWAAIPTILFTGLGDILNPEFLKSLRVAAVVPKPAAGTRLVDAVTSVFDGRRQSGALALSETCVPSARTS